MSTITVNLFGGLGNQLFQYAAGRSLAERTGSKLILDLSWFEDVHGMQDTTARKYSLSPFRINAELQTPAVPSVKFQSPLVNRIKRKLQRIGFLRDGKNVFHEGSARFDPRINTIKAPVLLNGYWQSYLYFESIIQIIQEEIGSVGIISDESRELLKLIKNNDSICVHIRRGDYVTNKKASVTHGLCGLEYYKQGLAVASKNLKNPICYVFSDDPDWVKENFLVDFPTTIVDINGPDDAHQDLWLMAACKSFVIANSSLSWWGSYLSNDEQKIVVAPSKWFLMQNLDTTDLIPEDWIRL